MSVSPSLAACAKDLTRNNHVSRKCGRGQSARQRAPPCVGSLQLPSVVIPAKAGIHLAASRCSAVDPGFRRDEGCNGAPLFSGGPESRRSGACSRRGALAMSAAAIPWAPERHRRVLPGFVATLGVALL